MLKREKLYLAARYDRQEEMLKLAESLEATGLFEVTARWVKGKHEMPLDPAESEERWTRSIALEDYIDLSRADTVISFTEDRSVGYNRGGRHVEFGIGLALGKRLIVVGKREHVFHWLDNVQQVKDIPGLFEALGLILVGEKEKEYA